MSQTPSVPAAVESNRSWFSYSTRTLLAVVALAGVGTLQAMRYWENNRPIEWRPFSRQEVQQQNALGRDVLVGFTAKWDPSSVLNLRWLDTAPIPRLLRSKQVVTLQADYTNADPAISQELDALGIVSVPALVIYPAVGGTPIVLCGIVTPEVLAAQLEKL